MKINKGQISISPRELYFYSHIIIAIYLKSFVYNGKRTKYPVLCYSEEDGLWINNIAKADKRLEKEMFFNFEVEK